KNARPGNTKGALGWIEAAKRTPYRTGPMTAVTPLMLAFAPCSWPCCDGLTKRVMRLCNAGCTRPIGAKTKMATTKMIQFDARPGTARDWTKITAPRLKSCGFDLNRTSEPSGLAFRQRNRSRFLTDRDSGKRRRPYEALVTEKAAAAQKGYRGPRSATSPPKA